MPQTLGKYQVVREIARSGMGVVYLGHDPFIDRPVALKVALSESLKDEETGERYRKMFFNEAHTAGMLRHPNILEIFDAGVDGDICYIVMEYINGGKTLKPHCKPGNLLPVNHVVEIIFKCAKALDYAHRQGVIHRDIKPSNLLYTEDADVKVADFSIAHLARPDAAQTLPMGFMGSPRYMSPEQVQQDDITHQTDLFSLGVVMYELLTGVHPFMSDSFSALIHKVINEDPPPMLQHRADLPRRLDKIVQRALRKDPTTRYKMGMDLASDLATACSYLDRPQEDISIKHKFKEVTRLDFFQGFPEEEVWEVIRASIWQEFGPDDKIVTEGEIDDAFYMLVAGTVVVKKGDGVVSTLKSGDCFGEMGYITKVKRTASIVATGPVSLIKINFTLLEQVSEDCQLRFCKAFLRTVIRRLSLTSDAPPSR